MTHVFVVLLHCVVVWVCVMWALFFREIISTSLPCPLREIIVFCFLVFLREIILYGDPSSLLC